MPLCKILKDVDAERVAFAYNPRSIVTKLPEQAKNFLQAEGTRKKSDFKINDLVSAQIGLTASEGKLLEDKIEKLAIEKLAHVQEQAYKEAYELGQAEGREDAFNAVKADLEEKIDKFSQVIASVSELKKELVTHNESHVVKLIAFIASRVAMREITLDREAILPVLTAALEDAQNEEKILIKISNEDMQFIESLGDEVQKKFEMLKNIKFEAFDNITRGGCIIETNYGQVDATIEQRVNKVWEHFEDKVPSVKDQVG